MSGVTLGVSYLISLLGVWFGTLVGDSGYGFVQLAVIAFVSGYALVAAPSVSLAPREEDRRRV